MAMVNGPRLGAPPAGFTEGTGDNYGRFRVTVGGVTYNVVGDFGGQLDLEDDNGQTPFDASGRPLTVSDVDLNAYLASPEYAAIAVAARNADAIAQATPQMRAILTDPEWQSYAGGQIPPWSQISPELQAKIQQVPWLYAQLTNASNFAALTAASQAAEDAAAAAAAAAASRTAHYMVLGIDFDNAGNVYTSQGTVDPTRKLSAAQVTSLLQFENWSGAAPPSWWSPSSAPSPTGVSVGASTGAPSSNPVAPSPPTPIAVPPAASSPASAVPSSPPAFPSPSSGDLSPSAPPLIDPGVSSGTGVAFGDANPGASASGVQPAPAAATPGTGSAFGKDALWIGGGIAALLLLGKRKK